MIRPRDVALSLLGAWLLVVGVSTLMPTNGLTPPLTPGRFLCVGCSARATADGILNWLLFLPGGVLMTLVLGGRRAMRAALGLTVALEVIQIGLAGRDPALQDLLFNALGAVSGVVLVRRGVGSPGWRALGASAALAWLAPTVLLVPLTTSAQLFGQWTPAHSSLEVYRGRVLAARVGDVQVRSGPVADPLQLALERALARRDSVVLQLVVGPAPVSFAPVFQVADAIPVGILSIGLSRQDLVLRGKTLSHSLHLDRPDGRWAGAMSGLTPGDTVRVVVRRSDPGTCVTLGVRVRCGVAPSLGEGWGHLLNLDSVGSGLRVALTVLWCLGLGLLIGAATGSRAWVAGIGLAVVGLVVGGIGAHVRFDLLGPLLLAGGAVLGGYARPRAAGLWRWLGGGALGAADGPE